MTHVGVVIAGNNTYLDACREESAEHNNDITEYPIEDGSKIHSHAHLLPRHITAEGIVVGPGYEAKVENLKSIRDNRDIVDYSGRMYYSSLVIKELIESYDPEIFNGARIRLVFQEVKIVGGGVAGPGVSDDPVGDWWDI